MCCSSAKVIWFTVKFLTREWGGGWEGRAEEGRGGGERRRRERGVQEREKMWGEKMDIYGPQYLLDPSSTNILHAH